MSTIPEFNPISFAKWSKLNADLEIADCEECNGEGDTVCPCCGHEIECLDCDGTGKEHGGARAIYDRMIAKDRAAYERYYGLPVTAPNLITIGGRVVLPQRPVLIRVRPG